VATGTGTLIGIGPTKAAKIWYRALTVYMTSGTSCAGARAATKAADDLYGVGRAESSAVAAAWTAVNRL
jgi:Zn-dependent metalloprotease